MVNKWVVGGTGTGFIILLILASTLYVSDYRKILAEHPEESLVLLLNQSDKIEILGRSAESSIEFVRWQYKGDSVKVYFGSNLVGNSYWRVYDGIKQIKYKEVSPYEYDGNVIRQSIVYYSDAFHTRQIGVFRKEIEVYPDTNKESVIFSPFNASRKYNLRWAVSDLDERNVSATLTKEGFKLFDNGFKVKWASDAPHSSVREFKTGKIEVIYASKAGVQKIDPIIGTLDVDDYILIDSPNKECAFNVPDSCATEITLKNPLASNISIPCGNYSVLEKKLETTFENLANVTKTSYFDANTDIPRNLSLFCQFTLNLLPGNRAECVADNGSILWNNIYYGNVSNNTIIYTKNITEKVTYGKNTTTQEFIPLNCPIVIPPKGSKAFRFKYHVSPYEKSEWSFGFLSWLKHPFLNGTLYQQTFATDGDINYSRSFNVTVSGGAAVPNSTTTGGGTTGTNYSAYVGTEANIHFLWHMSNTSSAFNNSNLVWAGNNPEFAHNDTDVFTGAASGSKRRNDTGLVATTNKIYLNNRTNFNGIAGTSATIEFKFKLERPFNSSGCIDDFALYSTRNFGEANGAHAVYLRCGGNLASNDGTSPNGALVLKIFLGSYYWAHTNGTYGVQGWPKEVFINVSVIFNGSRQTIIVNGVENVTDLSAYSSEADLTAIRFFNNNVNFPDVSGNFSLDEVAIFNRAKTWREYEAPSGSGGTTTYRNGTLYSTVINETVTWTRARVLVNRTIEAGVTNASFFVCDGKYANCEAAEPGTDVVPSAARTGLTYIINFTTVDTTKGASVDEINISLVLEAHGNLLYVEGINSSNFTYEIYTTANVTAVSKLGGNICVSYNETLYCGSSPLYLNLTQSILNMNYDNGSSRQVVWYSNNADNKTNLTFAFNNRTDLLSSKVRLNGSADASGLFPRNITINALAPQEEGNNASVDVVLPGELQGQNLTQIWFMHNGSLSVVKNFTMVSRSRQVFYINMTNNSFVQKLQYHNISFGFRGYDIDINNEISFKEVFNSTKNISSNNMGNPINLFYDNFEGGDGLARNTDRYGEGGDCQDGSPNISVSTLDEDGYMFLHPTIGGSGEPICYFYAQNVDMKIAKRMNIKFQRDQKETGSPISGSRFWLYIYDGTNKFQIYRQDFSGNGPPTKSNQTISIERFGTSTSPSFLVEGTRYNPSSSDLDFDKNWSLYLQGQIIAGLDVVFRIWELNVSGIILPMNDTGEFGINTTKNISSGIIQNTTEVIRRAKLCVTYLEDDPDANSELYLSADNGTNWEKTSNCDLLSFANSGSSLRWRIGMNSTNGVDSDYIANLSVEVIKGSVTNVSVDLGDDGSFEYEKNQSINSTSSLNATMNSSGIKNYVDTKCFKRTCWVPIAVQTDGGGTLQLNLTFPVTLGFLDINSSSFETRQVANAEFSWSKGKLSVVEMQNLYRGSWNSSIIANISASLFSNNLSINVVYSKFNLSYPPNISFYDVVFSNRTQFNVTPSGQTKNRGIWNISSFAYDRKFDVYVLVNGTFSNGSLSTALNFSLNSSNGTMLAIPTTLNGTGDKRGHLICKNLSIQNLTVVTGLSWQSPTPAHNASFKPNWMLLNVTVHSNDSAIHRFMFRVNGTNYTNVNQSNFTLSNYTGLGHYFSLNVTNLSIGQNYSFFAWVNLTTGNFYQSETRSIVSNTTNASASFVQTSSDYDARYCSIFHYLDARNISSRVQTPYFNIVSICDICVRTWDFMKSNPVIQRI